MKKYADNLMRVLEDMRGKLTQLERTTDRLESTVAELQNRSADHHGEVDGRVRGLEHVLREVGTVHGRRLL
jgi:predicted  nucleic acid-binding Zn-ribbon protein